MAIDFAECATCRTISLLWACKDKYKLLQDCMFQLYVFVYTNRSVANASWFTNGAAQAQRVWTKPGPNTSGNGINSLLLRSPEVKDLLHFHTTCMYYHSPTVHRSLSVFFCNLRIETPLHIINYKGFIPTKSLNLSNVRKLTMVWTPSWQQDSLVNV